MALSEYEPGAAFPGVIGRTTDVSSPAWPVAPRPAPGTPNVLVVVLEDTGFGQLGCYGSPIETPTFDALAENGLRYSNMHTTALCSPSRSCILTGRNHHSNSMAFVTELAPGYPGYNGVIPFENGMLSEMLLGHGYNTFMVGRWHLTPSNHEARQLYVDGTLAADADTPVTTPFVLNPGALTCGANPGSPVTPDYPSPFRFTGTLHQVVVDVSGELITDADSEMRMAVARQ